MTTLPRPPVFGTPRYKIWIFNTKYTAADCASELDVDYDSTRAGWMELPRGLEQKYSSDHIAALSIKEMIDHVQMSFEVSDIDIDVYKYDAVMRARDSVFVDGISADWQLANPCLLMVQVDSTGFSSSDTAGTVTITGTDVDDAAQTEVITINGNGTYVSSKTFKTIGTGGISCARLDNCVLSVWGDIGTGFARREMRIYGNTYDNWVTRGGLAYAGFTWVETRDVAYNDITYRVVGVGYDDFQKSSEYIGGFRANVRCRHYRKTGATGNCAVSSDNWQVSGKCFVGDFNTFHPDMTTACSTENRCIDYAKPLSVADYEYLPYDGYTYFDGYEDETGPRYSPYPKDYFRAGIACERMCRSYEHNGKFSVPTSLYLVGTAKLRASITNASTIISLTGFNGDASKLSGPLYAVIEDANGNREVVYSSTGYGTSMGVARGALQYGPLGFNAGSIVYFYSAGIVSRKLVSSDDLLIEGNIGSSIKATLDSLAEILTERMTNSEWVAWVDKFRQIHFDEMYGDNLGQSSTFTIAEEDISAVSGLKVTDVVNSVSAWVTLDDGARYYPTLNVEETAVDPNGVSRARYGRRWEEISNKQLNAIGATDLANGRIGFTTFATNYLRTHAFPKHIQTIELLSTFIPDEHYWTNGNKPLLVYSDARNKHIDLRTHRVTCPDYNIPGHPDAVFVVEGVSYKANQYGELRTFLHLSRITTA